ncbi:hypothetical protein GGH12_001779 [Coemansia sp. RSA 1822]|nr:hypothetical protein LPJ76_003551 [Coemansia sp. RSA 638]KAJ2541688.1 hypothetical protein GGF49_003480 [Coemansia sp. RSA 1853]KAJ2564811.1 hypothetical protein GGH12_001779 [Coemansia sp. RSA 1822]
MASKASSSSSPSFSKSAFPDTRTPSAVDFPGAFTTKPKSRRHISVGQIMKGGFAETVSGSLNNVVGGVYSIVNYVNPLGSGKAGEHGASDSGHSEASDKPGSGEPKTSSGELKPDPAEPKPDSPLLLHAPSAGTSVAADLDEHCLADANADNPENNRPPTPTKTSFTRMLRFPAHSVTDPSMHASSAEYKQAVRNDPVSRNVSQRTGQQFRPGAEEKRRYMRRMSKAPQIEATPLDTRRSTSEQRRKRSTSVASSIPSDDSDESESDEEVDAEIAQFYQAAATQRSDSKNRAIEPWRFISPRVKRVKRRVLWRLFLAQELNPAVYDEATHVANASATPSITSSPVVSPQSARAPVPASPRSPPSTVVGSSRRDVQSVGDVASMRRRMLEPASRTDDSHKGQNSHGRLRTPSVAPSVDSLGSGVAQTRVAEPMHKNAVWTMEFSVCGKYLAAGGQDGVVRVWRIAPFAREQAAEKRRSESPSSASGTGLPQAVQAAGRARNTGTFGDANGPGRAHIRQKSAMHEGSDMMPFTNAAPIAKGKHLRTFSVGQPTLPARCARQLHDPEPLTSPPIASTDCADPDSAQTAQLHPMHAYELLEPVPFRSYVGHTSDVLALSWSKNGFLLSASMDRTVRLWHPHRPECLCTFRHRDIVTSVAFNPRDDRLFISGSLDCRLRLWDIPARSVRHWTRLPEGQMVTSVAYTGSKGDNIVAGTYRGMCVFYSTDGLAVQGRMHARSSRGRNAKGSKITGFANAPTGQMPAALLRRLLGPAQYDTLISHPRLLVSSNDSRLRMFLPSERELERKYKGHANASSQAYARLSADGRYIVSGSEDHNIYVWPVAQDNAATVSTHPNSDHIRRAGRATPAANTEAVRSEKPLLATLFGRKRTQYEQTKQVDTTEEWESLDGKVEEKSIYEYFPAHDAAVSQALFVPAVTLQYLADHDDPIFSRRKMRRTKPSGDVENILPASPNATFGGSQSLGEDTDELRDAVEDMTSIIVSADTNGCIRVFRKDINVHTSEGADQNQSHVSLIRAKESVGSLTRAITRDKNSDLDSYAMHAEHMKHPPSLTSTPSFWNRLGRRMSQKRHTSSTFAGLPSSTEDVPRARAASGSESMSLAAIAETSSVSVNKQTNVCAHCGNDKFIDFAVAPAGTANQPVSISVCEKCKHVRNLPV